jgi:phosphatidylglycerophosphate synthase
MPSELPVVHIRGDSKMPIWGMHTAQRLRRQVQMLGATEILLVEKLGPDEPVLLLRGDFVYDDGLLRSLLTRPDVMLTIDAADGRPRPIAVHTRACRAELDLSGLDRPDSPEAMTPLQLTGRYNEALRSLNEPYALPVNEATLASVEQRMFQATYKGATDFVTKFVWPWPARHVTRWCAQAGLTPNQVTFVSLIFCLAATWLFWIGWFWTGVAVGWFMTFLDTVDGKLARVTVTSSKWGDVFDHGIDLVHPPFWYLTWYMGLLATQQLEPSRGVLDISIIIILAGYAAGRLIEGAFLALFTMHIHVWQRVDHVMRFITARRNPNLFLLMVGLAFGAPDWGLVTVAAWTVICTLFHLVRLGQALAWKRAQWPVESWMAKVDQA